MNSRIMRILLPVFLLVAVDVLASDVKVLQVNVYGNDGTPVSDALVTGRFYLDAFSGGLDKRTTNSQGVAIISGKEDLYVDIDVNKDAYYRSKSRVVVHSGKSFDVSILLRKKRNPIPMYAKKVVLNARGTRVSGEAFGYDLLAGDFVSPHGKGLVNDILVTHTFETNDTHDYQSSITIEFSNLGDGIIPFLDSPDSEFKSAYSAPADGYVGTWSIDEARKEGVIQSSRDPSRNYYFRVRTEYDEDGRLVSSHYGKIYGEFPNVTYYMNPSSGDRNVEFEVGSNLFGDLPVRERAVAP